MKRAAVILLFTALLLSVCSCSGNEESAEMDRWLSSARLDAEETPEELYENARSEDTLIIYSNSTRVMDVKESFEAQYPGLTVYVNDVRSADLIEMLENNFQSKDFECDVVLCDDNNGTISQDLIPRGLLYKYVPYDLVDKIKPEYNQITLNLMGEVQQIFYNSAVYDAQPIHNWWELTEERFRGKVVMPNPIKSFSTMGLFTMIIYNSDIMAQAYYDLYGHELTLKDGETAGEAFWRMMIENGLVIVNSGDEVLELMGASDQTATPIGIMISSEVRYQDLGYSIEPIFDMDSFTGTYSPNSIMIAGGSKNINSAKLFIRWILGESDGQGEGYQPYLQNGTWSVRTDVQSETATALENITVLQLNTEYIFNHLGEMKSYWAHLTSPG